MNIFLFIRALTLLLFENTILILWRELNFLQSCAGNQRFAQERAILIWIRQRKMLRAVLSSCPDLKQFFLIKPHLKSLATSNLVTDFFFNLKDFRENAAVNLKGGIYIYILNDLL